MDYKKMLVGFFSAAGMCILVLDGQTALEGCRSGLELCAQTVIPSIFPFLWINGILNSSLSGLNIPALDYISSLFRYPKGYSSIFISSVLGGYPSGAQAVGLCYQTGKISRENADKLLAVSNNAGPAFIFGLVGHMFSEPGTTWILWMIQLLGAMIVSIILLPYDNPMPVPATEGASNHNSLEHSVHSMLNICGWIIIFRTGISFLQKWVLKGASVALYTMTAGFLELSNGCCLLGTIQNSSVRFVLCSVLLSFGGVCVFMQTASVTKGLRLRYYALGKTLQALCSFALAYAYTLKPLILYVTAGMILFAGIRKTKNYCRKAEPLRV